MFRMTKKGAAENGKDEFGPFLLLNYLNFAPNYEKYDDHG